METKEKVSLPRHANGRQRKLIKELPKHNFSVRKAGVRAGYSESYSNSGLPRVIRNCKEFKDIFTSENTKKKILKAQKRFKKQKDNTNESRMIELEARLTCPELRKVEMDNKNPDKVVIMYEKAKPEVHK